MVRRHIDNIRGRKSPSSPLSDEDKPEADSSSQTDPAADDLVDPLTLPDLPTDPVNPPETHGVLPVPSPPNPTAPETQDPPRQDPPPPRPPPQSGPPRRRKRYLRVFESLYDPRSSHVFNYRLQAKRGEVW